MNQLRYVLGIPYQRSNAESAPQIPSRNKQQAAANAPLPCNAVTPAIKAEHQLIHNLLNGFDQPAYFKTWQQPTQLMTNSTYADTINIQDKSFETILLTQAPATLDQSLQQKWLRKLLLLEKQMIQTLAPIRREKLPIFIDGNGHIQRYTISIQFVHYPDGTISGLLGVLHNDTHHIASETLLQQYHEFYPNPKEAIQHFLDHIGFTKALDGDQTITQRELDCMTHLAKGLTAKETAKVLHISHRTVETHLENIKVKLNINKKTEILSIFFKYYRSAV